MLFPQSPVAQARITMRFLERYPRDHPQWWLRGLPHSGVDLTGYATYPVKPCADGVVMGVWWSAAHANTQIIIIRHDLPEIGLFWGVYAHMMGYAIDDKGRYLRDENKRLIRGVYPHVKAGAKVTWRTELGIVDPKLKHLHFEMCRIYRPHFAPRTEATIRRYFLDPAPLLHYVAVA